MNVLLVARSDAAVAFRTALQDAHGARHGKIAATPYRRTGDTPGTPTYYVAHGEMKPRVRGVVLASLISATEGLRDSTNWQGKAGGTPVAEAEWAVAYDGADIVAGFRVTSRDNTPRAILESLGLVPVSADADPGA